MAERKRRRTQPPGQQPGGGSDTGAATAAAAEGAGATSVASVLAQAFGSAGGSTQGPDPTLADRFGQLFASGSGGATEVRPAAGGAVASSSRPAASAKAPAGATAAGKASPAKAAGKAKPARKQLNKWERREQEARTLFVGNVPLKWDIKDLRRALRAALGEKYTGPMRPVRFRSEPLEDRYSGRQQKVGRILKAYAEGVSDAKNAYVVLDSPDAVDVVRKVVHGLQADPQHILRADGVGENSRNLKFDRKRSIFVGNLPVSTTEADLRRALGQAGEIDAVRIIRDKVTQGCKGFAFVRFRQRSSVRAALDLWDVQIGGWTIRITQVQAEKDEEEEEAKSRKQLEQLHPAERRQMLRDQKRQRQRIKAAKEAYVRAKAENDSGRGSKKKKRSAKEAKKGRKKGRS